MGSKNFLLEILIRAKDQAGKTFDGLRGKVKGLFTSFTELRSALSLASQAFTIIQGVVDRFVKKSVEYAQQVREISQFTGLTAEETSRLIQVANDWEIEIGQLRNAMKLMVQNGVKPSIANLAALADEYVAVGGGAEFAEKANKLLGKQWATLVPLFAKGGDKLKDYAAAIDDSLVLTNEDIQATRELQVAVDGLNDAAEGFSLTIGLKAIPKLTAFLILLEKLMSLDPKNWFKDGADAAADFINKFFYGKKNAQEFAEALARIYREQKDADLMPRGLAELPALLDDATGSADSLNQAMGQLRDLIGGSLSSDYEDFSDEQGELGIRIREVQDRILELNGKKYLTVAQKEELADAKLEFGELDTAIREHAAAHEEATKRILFDILSRQAAMDGLTATEVQALTDIASSWGLIDPATKTAMDAASLFFGELQDGAKLSQKEMDELRRKMLGLPKSHSFTVTTYKKTVVQNGPGGTTFETGGGGQGDAQGADFIVPPGYPNDTYPEMVESGERVIVMNREQQRRAGSRGGVNPMGSLGGGRPIYIGEINMNVFPPDGADAAEVAELVVAKLSQAISGGASMIYAE